MRKLFWSFIVFLVSVGSVKAAPLPGTEVVINGEAARVFFNDGDTFRILSGSLQGKRSRTAGFNTLESYGPVHRWGTFSRLELKRNADEATQNARRGGWHCTTDLKEDVYGRILTNCMDLALDQIQKGLAHVMSVTEEKGDPVLIANQQVAMRARVGMWEKGVPSYIITSLHSVEETPNQKNTYDRFVSTADGHSVMERHQNSYENCEDVCYSPHEDSVASGQRADSCMIYVKFANRFGPRKAECLK